MNYRIFKRFHKLYIHIRADEKSSPLTFHKEPEDDQFNFLEEIIHIVFGNFFFLIK